MHQVEGKIQRTHILISPFQSKIQYLGIQINRIEFPLPENLNPYILYIKTIRRSSVIKIR